MWLFQLGRFPVPFPLTWHLYFFILALGIHDYIQLEKLMNCIVYVIFVSSIELSQAALSTLVIFGDHFSYIAHF